MAKKKEQKKEDPAPETTDPNLPREQNETGDPNRVGMSLGEEEEKRIAAKVEANKPVVSRPLFVVSNEIREIMEFMMEAYGNAEETSKLEKRLEGLDMELATKATNIVRLSKALDSEIRMAKEEEQRIAAWRKSRENAKEWGRKYLAAAMNATETKSIKSIGMTITLCPGRETVKIDKDALTDDYVAVKVVEVVEPMTEKIEAALRAKVVVPGAEIVTGLPYIQVR